MARMNIDRGSDHSNYVKIFNSEKLGRLISIIQSTTISTGTELEKMITAESNLVGIFIKDLDQFLENEPYDGIFICTKKEVKNSKINIKSAQPDFMIFVHDNGTKHCFVLELKWGIDFDTKKSDGEVGMLKKYKKELSTKIPHEIFIKICSFMAKTKNDMVTGLKGRVTENDVITGYELCRWIGIDYDKILKSLSDDAEFNFKFFIENLLNIEEVFYEIEDLKNKNKTNI